MGIPMIAKRLHVYAGHNHKPGQEFEAHSESNARFLEHVGHAQRAPKKVEAAAAYQTRALVAATPAAPVVARNPAPTASAFAEKKVVPPVDRPAAPRPRATRPATQGDKE